MDNHKNKLGYDYLISLHSIGDHLLSCQQIADKIIEEEYHNARLLSMELQSNILTYLIVSQLLSISLAMKWYTLNRELSFRLSNSLHAKLAGAEN